MLNELHKAGRPIPDREIFEFVQDKVSESYAYLYERNLHPLFLEKYKLWIKNSTNNGILGLNEFKELTYTHGTSQSFDCFYFKHNQRRLRILKGDFLYHKLCTQKSIHFKYLDDGVLEASDFLIISVPFSDSGNTPINLEEILTECDEMGIPVWIDAAYMVMASGIYLDLNHKCIEGISFSLTKGFYGCERLRIGVRMKRIYEDDGIDVANSMSMVSAVGCYVGNEIISKFDVDYIYNKYRSRQIILCEEYGLTPSDSVIFGLGESTISEFDIYNRGTNFRRVCLSDEMGDFPLDDPTLTYYDSKFK